MSKKSRGVLKSGAKIKIKEEGLDIFGRRGTQASGTRGGAAIWKWLARGAAVHDLFTLHAVLVHDKNRVV